MCALHCRLLHRATRPGHVLRLSSRHIFTRGRRLQLPAMCCAARELGQGIRMYAVRRAGQFANADTWTCDTCASGFVSVGDGRTECRAREAGTVSNVAATACDACPPGHVNPEPNASWGCEPCPWRLWLVSWSASSVRAAMSPTRYVRRARRVLPVTSRRRKAHQAAQHVSPGTPRGPYVD